MQSVISCSCCCFSAHRSHFACFSRAMGDDVFAIKSGMRKFRIDQDFLIEHWHMIYVMSVAFAEIYV